MPDQRVPNPNILKRPVLVATQLGVPTCILDWENAIMSLLPTSVGNSLAQGVKDGIEQANALYGTLLNGIFDLIGVDVWDSANGTFMWERTVDGDPLGGSEGFQGFIEALSFGAQAWNNYIVVREQYEKIASCFDEIFGDDDPSTTPSGDDTPGVCLEDADCPPGMICIDGICSLPFTAGDSGDTEGNRQLLLAQADNLATFLRKAETWRDRWGEVLAARAADPSLEPDFGELGASSTPLAAEPIFDLVYGPPVLKNGQLIMSSDGLYYDSQSRTYKDGSDVPTPADIGFVSLPEAWKMDHFPSLGGKGQSYTMDDLETYVDTLFDVNQIDTGEDIKPHYSADHLIQVMEGQKTKEVYDVSTQVTSLVASGYERDSAMVVNLKQTLYATIASFNKKINKRKKQIEVAVKAPDLYGSSSFALGQVPINDFSFLKDINLSVDVRRQRELVFAQGEVSSIILPIRPKFVRAVDSEGVPLINALVVPPVGVGTIQNRAVEVGSASSVGKIISLTDDIITKDLFAIYSFLQGKVLKPDSKDYQVLNCASRDNYNNCQLVAASAQGVFVSGLGIPFLQGIPKVGFNPNSRTPTTSGLGSYLRMPDTKEFQNLLYSPKGASIDFWIHLPKLNKLTRPYFGGGDEITDRADGAWSTYQYHKLILACENTGGKNLNQTATEITLDRGSDVVRGFVMGFTREKLISLDPVQNVIGDQNELDTDNNMVFYMAPTQSVNQTDVEFINKGDCYSTNNGIYKMIIPITKLANQVSIGRAKTEFMHMNVSFDVPKNEVSVYLDGNHLETSSISNVFGVESGEAPQLPSFYRNKSDSSTSSFTYDIGNVNQVGTSEFDEGPSLNGFFTPWIVGGGWTDGIRADGGSDQGGFMNTNHGYKSGLDGFIGSLKFYSRPLNKQEIYTNYSNQYEFFKNIKT